MEGLAVAVAALSFLVSVASLWVAIRAHRSGGPVVRIRIRQSVMMQLVEGKPQAFHTLIVSVVNAGRSPVTVADAMIEDARHGGGIGLQPTPDSPDEVKTRIEGTDLAEWRVDMDKLREFFTERAKNMGYAWEGKVVVRVGLPDNSVRSSPIFIGSTSRPSTLILGDSP